MRYIATLLGGSGRLTSSCTLSHCRGALPWGNEQWNSFWSLPPCPMQWVVEPHLYIASLPWGNGFLNSFFKLPHYLGAVELL